MIGKFLGKIIRKREPVETREYGTLFDVIVKAVDSSETEGFSLITVDDDDGILKTVCVDKPYEECVKAYVIGERTNLVIVKSRSVSA